MTKTNKSSPRNLVRQLIAENRTDIAKRLNELFASWSDDLTAAGIDRKQVADALIAVGMAEGIACSGPKATADRLRHLASLADRVAHEITAMRH